MFYASLDILEHIFWYVDKGWAQWSRIAVACLLNRDFGCRFAPAKIRWAAASSSQAKDDLSRRFHVILIDCIPETQHWPGAHPGIDGPAAGSPKGGERVILCLVDEDAHLALDILHEPHEFGSGSVAILHGHDVGALGNPFKGIHR